jgi:hypothetical protein
VVVGSPVWREGWPPRTLAGRSPSPSQNMSAGDSQGGQGRVSPPAEGAEPGSATPILDLLLPLPEKRAGRRWSSFLVWMVVGFVGASGYRLVRDRAGLGWIDDLLGAIAPPLSGGWMVGVVVVIGALYAAVTLHELGHVAAARLIGIRVASLSIGRLALVRHGDSMKMAIAADDVTAGFATFDSLPDRDLRRPFALVFLGGPLMNAVVAASASLLVFSGAMAPLPWLQWGVGVLGAASALLCLELLPYETRGHESDGRRVLALARDGERGRSFLSLLALQREIEKGVRPRDLPAAWLASARRARPQTRDFVHAQLLSFAAACDRQDQVAAAGHLERCLERISNAPPEIAAQLPVEAAVFHAWYRRDCSRAATWRDRAARPEALPPLTRARLEAALACCELRFDDALREWEIGMRAIRDMPPSAQRDLLHDGWLEWRVEIAERAAR